MSLRKECKISPKISPLRPMFFEGVSLLILGKSHPGNKPEKRSINAGFPQKIGEDPE